MSIRWFAGNRTAGGERDGACQGAAGRVTGALLRSLGMEDITKMVVEHKSARTGYAFHLPKRTAC
jgi:hypothetical protein